MVTNPSVCIAGRDNGAFADLHCSNGAVSANLFSFSSNFILC